MTVQEICQRLNELRAFNGLSDDFEERMEEREDLCVMLRRHTRACQDASCWCKKEWRQYGEA